MKCYVCRPAFIIIKDHKPNFRNNSKCRLINPAKNKLGLASKKYLEKISRMLQTPSKSINGKVLPLSETGLSHFRKKTRFVKFDIVEFFPSISEELLIVPFHLLVLQLPSATQLLQLSTTQENLSFSMKHPHD